MGSGIHPQGGGKGAAFLCTNMSTSVFVKYRTKRGYLIWSELELGAWIPF